MSARLQRAELLLAQDRHAQAEEELRLALTEDPNNADAHAMLALCLQEQSRGDEALREAQLAIGLAPDRPHGHYVRGVVLTRLDREPEAQASLKEAIRLDPEDPHYRAWLAISLSGQEKWPAALEAANEGLALDPEHSLCLNMRAAALTHLGRKDEAADTIDAAMRRNPDDPFAHSNRGWAALHAGDTRAALEHFREALRLAPDMEVARNGLLCALRARNIIYRVLLAYFLWMVRLSKGARWGLIIGIYVFFRLMSKVAKDNPELGRYLLPVIIVYVAFVALTWTATPLFNLLLRFNRFGKYVLSKEERTASNWIAATIGMAATSAIGLYLVREHLPRHEAGLWILPSIAFAMLMIPIGGAFSRQRGQRRAPLFVLAGLGAAGALTSLAAAPFAPTLTALGFGVAAFSAIAFSWVANFVR